MPWWIPIVTAVAAGIILFFLLPTLEPTRTKFLVWIGIKKPVKEHIKPVQEPPPASAPANPVIEVSSTPAIDPGMIYAAIDQTPLLQRSEAVKHYIGIKVDWTGKLISLHPRPDGKIKVAVGWKDRALQCFDFFVTPEECPGVGLLKSDDPIRVMGTISEIELPYPIHLKDATLVEYGMLKK